MFLLSAKQKNQIKEDYIKYNLDEFNHTINSSKQELLNLNDELARQKKELEDKINQTKANIDQTNEDYIASLKIELTDDQKRKLINKELTKQQKQFSKYIKFIKNRRFDKFNQNLKIIINIYSFNRKIIFKPLSNNGFHQNLPDIITEYLKINNVGISYNTTKDKIKQIFENFPCYDIISLNSKYNINTKEKSYIVVLTKNNEYSEVFEGNQGSPPPSYESIKTEPSAPFEDDETASSDKEKSDNYSSRRSHTSTTNNDTSYFMEAAAITMLGDID